MPAAPANRFVLAQLKGQGIPWLFFHTGDKTGIHGAQKI